MNEPWITGRVPRSLITELSIKCRKLKLSTMDTIETEPGEVRQVQGAYFVSSKLVRAFEQFTEEAVERWDISWRNFEMFNYLSYDAGDFYSWHRDEDDDGPRQLTMIMALNDDYTGGGVELAWRQEMVFKMSVGEVLVFPAKLYHRALPVHSGQRRVIVGWATSD